MVRIDLSATESVGRISKLIEGRQWNSKFIAYAPSIFRRIREMDGISTETFLQAFDEEIILKSFHKHKFSEGRSGSFFIFTPDKKFILKTIPRAESTLLLHILRNYYSVSILLLLLF